MKMKFFASLLCIAISATLFAQAPTPKAKSQKPKQYPSEQMIKDLNLSTQQVASLKQLQKEEQAIRIKFKEGNKENAQKDKAQREQIKANMEKARANHQAKMKQILTPEQYTKFLEIQLQQKRMKDNQHKPHHPARQNKECPTK